MMSDGKRQSFQGLDTAEQGNPSPVKTVRALSKELDALENKVLLEVATMREMLLCVPEAPMDEACLREFRQTVTEAFSRLSKMKEDIFHGLDQLDSQFPKPAAPIDVSSEEKAKTDIDSFLFQYLTDLKKL